MPSININICQNFSVAGGVPIVWTGIPPTGCSLTPDGASPWPFNIGPPIVFPMPSAREITIKHGLASGTYHFIASCCPKPISVTVT